MAFKTKLRLPTSLVVPSMAAGVGSAELLAGLIEAFGRELGEDYFERGLTFDQADREAEATPEPARRQGLASRIRFSKSGFRLPRQRREAVADA